MNAAWFDPDPLVRPSLDESIAALLVADARFPWVKPTDEESDAAEAIRHIAAAHRGSAGRCDNPDEPMHCNRTWGTCTECRDEPWPCAIWSDAHALAVEYIGRAHNRYAAHAKAAVDRLDAAANEHRESA